MKIILRNQFWGRFMQVFRGGVSRNATAARIKTGDFEIPIV
jgi:hypothetical protein